MTPPTVRTVPRARGWRVGLMFALAVAAANGAEPSAAQVEELIGQNRRLQEQVRAQQKTIDELLRASERHERELRGLQERTVAAPAGPAASREQQVRVAAESGFTYFKTGRDGQFPKGEFRIDDPVVTLEAPVMKDVYLFAELKLLPRETNEEKFELGELYVDFEDVLARAGQPGLLSIRAGRIGIPFGEEYQVRSPLANPLISHSLSDLWGVDEGIEAYGRIGPIRYVVAVQNGGVSRLRDYHRDKAVTARLSWEPARWLQVSASAMRTGRLATVEDELSELWFGDAFFRALGPSPRTENFHANLVEGDAIARWRSGRVSGALGQVRFDDSDPVADNSRRIRYGYLQLVQTIANRLYGAVRYSEIDAPRGYPLAGWGSRGTFFFRPSLTDELHRLSVGLGWRFSPSLVWKIEQTWESGRLLSGVRREHEDFFGSQLGMKF